MSFIALDYNILNPSSFTFPLFRFSHVHLCSFSCCFMHICICIYIITTYSICVMLLTSSNSPFGIRYWCAFLLWGLVLIFNLTQSTVNWKELLNERLFSRSDCPMGVPLGNYLGYINWCVRHSPPLAAHSLGLGSELWDSRESKLSSKHACNTFSSVIDCGCDIASYFVFLPWLLCKDRDCTWEPWPQIIPCSSMLFP